jgi:hypothetical protein
MFVCRTDSVIFMLICRVQAYFGVSELLGQDDRRYRPSRSVPHDLEEAVPQIAPGFHDVSTKISCLVCMSSSSGMKRIGVALFAPELRCKLENAPGTDWETY